MKTLKSYQVVAFIVSLALSPLCAQEFKAAKKGGKAAEAEEVVNVQGDKGIEVVRGVQEGELDDFNKPEKKPADEQVRDLLFKEFKATQGWDDKKKVMYQIGVVKFTIEDPYRKANFFAIRDLMAKRAVVMAKGEIIRSIMTDMSGEDQIDIPGTDPNKELSKEYTEALKVMQKQYAIVRALAMEEGILRKRAAEGVTDKDRGSAFMDWTLRELDKTYSSKKITAEKRKKYLEAKKAYKTALKELDALGKKANRLIESLRGKQTSSVELYARMPLLGAATVWQSESWFKAPPRKGDQPNQYTVAVLVVWSKGLEKVARCTLDGTSVVTSKPVKPNKGFTNYVLKDLELGALNGPHVYVDDGGKRHFMGIAARPDTNLGRRAAKLSAFQMAVFSMMSDLEFYEKLNQQGNIYGLEEDMETMEMAESVTTKLSQSLTNYKIPGVKEVYQGTAFHPLSGRRVFVSVQHIDPVLAARAPSLFKDTHKNALAAMKRSQYLAGFIAGVEGSRGQAERDRGPYIAGVKDGQIKLDPKTGKPVKRGPKKGRNAKDKPGSKSSEGVNSPKKPKKLPF